MSTVCRQRCDQTIHEPDILRKISSVFCEVYSVLIWNIPNTIVVMAGMIGQKRTWLPSSCTAYSNKNDACHWEISWYKLDQRCKDLVCSHSLRSADALLPCQLFVLQHVSLKLDCPLEDHLHIFQCYLRLPKRMCLSYCNCTSKNITNLPPIQFDVGEVASFTKGLIEVESVFYVFWGFT